MNEEMEVMEINNETNEVEDTTNYESGETSGNGGLGIKVAIAVAAAVGVGIVAARKGKGKLDAMRIKKLEKKGYVVSKPEEVVDAEIIPEEEESDE